MIDRLFSKEEYDFPIISYKEDIITFFEKLLNDYLSDIRKENLVSEVQLNDTEIDLIEKTKNKIIKAIQSMLNGYPHRAYEHINELLEKDLKKYLLSFDMSLIEDNLFRARVLNNHTSYKKSEMFHIPLDKRHLINSYRYSIPGSPALYLGSSILVCFKELRCPDLNSICISAFKLDNQNSDYKFDIIDFGYRPQDILEAYKCVIENDNIEENNHICFPHKLDKDFFKKYIIIWPLIAACSIRPKFEEYNFKSEYIIPQLFLQWIKNSSSKTKKEFKAIRYFSNRIIEDCEDKKNLKENADKNNVSFFHNYVFPNYTEKNKYFCEILSENFRYTEAILWQNYSVLNEVILKNDYSEKYDSYVYINKGFHIRYQKTKFYEFEMTFKGMEFKKL